MKAVIDFSDGRRYVGEVNEAGEPHGEGVMTFPDREIRKGGWRRGLHHGQGAITFADGTHVEGVFNDGALPYRGLAIFPDGNQYDGEFCEGAPFAGVGRSRIQ